MAGATFEVTIKKKQHAMIGRMTAVLKKTGNRWLFELVHFSLSYPKQQPGESYPGWG